MKLYHYSRSENLSTTGILPRYHGNGIRGAESERKKQENWIDRSYYGTSDYDPENGLGNVAYSIDINENEIYNLSADKHNLRKKASTYNELELLIKSEGYNFYRNESYYPEIVACFISKLPVKLT